MNNITRKANQIFNSMYFRNLDVLIRSLANEKQLSICTDVQKLKFIILKTYKCTLCNPVVWHLHLRVKIFLMKRL